MKRKSIFVVVYLVVICLVFGGCGGKKTSSTDGEIKKKSELKYHQKVRLSKIAKTALTKRIKYIESKMSEVSEQIEEQKPTIAPNELSVEVEYIEITPEEYYAYEPGVSSSIPDDLVKLWEHKEDPFDFVFGEYFLHGDQLYFDGTYNDGPGESSYFIFIGDIEKLSGKRNYMCNENFKGFLISPNRLSCVKDGFSYYTKDYEYSGISKFICGNSCGYTPLAINEYIETNNQVGGKFIACDENTGHLVLVQEFVEFNYDIDSYEDTYSVFFFNISTDEVDKTISFSPNDRLIKDIKYDDGQLKVYYALKEKMLFKRGEDEYDDYNLIRIIHYEGFWYKFFRGSRKPNVEVYDTSANLISKFSFSGNYFLKGNHLYAIKKDAESQTSTLCCFDASTGAIVWESKTHILNFTQFEDYLLVSHEKGENIEFSSVDYQTGEFDSSPLPDVPIQKNYLTRFYGYMSSGYKVQKLGDLIIVGDRICYAPNNQIENSNLYEEDEYSTDRAYRNVIITRNDIVFSWIDDFEFFWGESGTYQGFKKWGFEASDSFEIINNTSDEKSFNISSKDERLTISDTDFSLAPGIKKEVFISQAVRKYGEDVFDVHKEIEFDDIRVTWDDGEKIIPVRFGSAFVPVFE